MSGPVTPHRMSDGLVRYGVLLWSKVRARKPGRCMVSRREYEKGEEVYRPITHGAERWKRVRADVWDKDPLDVCAESVDVS